MALLVKKFGGTSVGSIDKIKNIAKNISKSKDAGHDIVIVVSAMGHSTDDLNNLAYSISKTPPQKRAGYASFYRGTSYHCSTLNRT